MIPVLLMWIHIAAFAQCNIDSKAFAPGEALHYGAYYNWGFIWLHAGEVEFTVASKKYEGRDVYHLYSYGTTFKSYDWIFKIREKYQSYVDSQTLIPLRYERDVYEDGYTAFEDYRFDYKNNVIHTYVQKRKDPAVEGTLPITPCLFDLMSAVYYFRSVDFGKYTAGEKIPLNVVLESASYNLYMRYLGKEEVKTRNKKKYQCLKFAVQLVEGTIFKGDEDAIIWVTDDKNKIPVMVEAQILVGSVKAILTDAKGLKH
jgi:hypothetical protein